MPILISPVLSINNNLNEANYNKIKHNDFEILGVHHVCPFVRASKLFVCAFGFPPSPLVHATRLSLTPKIRTTQKMKITPTMKVSPEMKMTPKMKTTFIFRSLRYGRETVNPMAVLV